jgi:hypothetical protein
VIAQHKLLTSKIFSWQTIISRQISFHTTRFIDHSVLRTPIKQCLPSVESFNIGKFPVSFNWDSNKSEPHYKWQTQCECLQLYNLHSWVKAKRNNQKFSNNSLRCLVLSNCFCSLKFIFLISIIITRIHNAIFHCAKVHVLSHSKALTKLYQQQVFSLTLIAIYNCSNKGVLINSQAKRE